MDKLPYLSLDEQDSILSGPALPAPGSEVSNLKNPPNKETLGLVVIAVCLILSTVVLYIRVHTKVFYERKFRIEDCKYPIFLVNKC